MVIELYMPKVNPDGTMQTDDRFREIIRLHDMLTAENIPHSFEKWQDGWQVCYPVARPSPECVCDAVEFFGSYGHEHDLLEIMGLLTIEEKKQDSVLGWLPAEEVFERMSKHWKEVQKNADT